MNQLAPLRQAEDGISIHDAPRFIARLAQWMTVFPIVLIMPLVSAGYPSARVMAAGGTLTLTAADEQTDEPVITRMELWRGPIDGTAMPIRKAVPAGIGVVLDRSIELSLADGSYAFRMIRGPEYRVVTGTFAMERTALDTHAVRLPRTIHMIQHGWTSGDCCVVGSKHSVPLRMAAEDLHVAAVLGQIEASPIPYRDAAEPIRHDPTWIREDCVHHDGLVAYGMSSIDAKQLPSELLVQAKSDDKSVKMAVENPFAWPLPVWLASGRVDGFFLMGDWLRLDRPVTRVTDGRRPDRSTSGAKAIGSWAYQIYTNILESGLRIPPLAGSGNEGVTTPIGYNRLYVAASPATSNFGAARTTTNLDAVAVSSSDAWWDAAWAGHSVATNGPLLRPTINGKLPGHVFTATGGEELRLQPVLSLTTRDPVEYLEVVHNGQVHYRARLDEFAKAGGKIPPIHADQSGWVIIHVVTKHKDMFRAAISAPWYIEFDGQPRVSAAAVHFFQDWLSMYETRLKRLPPGQLARHVPFVRSARKFWSDRQP
mgnify:CR=1 FL=1|tara:strand:+ start:73071 stop:74687 length:1617 start_codon:yes stop_codon:yes gene_type:complete